MMEMRSVLDQYNGEGTVFGCINKDALNNLKIVVPPNDVIMQFEGIASVIDSQILICHDQICDLGELRDALLPRLMSGELKVSDVKL